MTFHFSMSTRLRVGAAAASRLIVLPSTAPANRYFYLDQQPPRSRYSIPLLRLHLALTLVVLNVTKLENVIVRLRLAAAAPSSAPPILLLMTEWLVLCLPTLRQMFFT